eukprot:TRINITY_DN51_c0_g1_i2.p1 TRINITY_DN51_c0_g1~~TRINITY_DN51_c0_g1_i2.p1  ORF type:complete len:299 (+),score=72.21 TRINITY_DN51_c0_g1_i2:65-898(+)
MASHRFLAAASTVGLAASAGVESCMTFGKGYNDPKLNMTPNGGIGLGSTKVTCQENCENTVFCAYWTWYNNTGGCWLQGINATLTIEDEGMVSGSMECVVKAKASNETGVVAAKEEVSSKELVAEPATSEGGGAGFPIWAWAIAGVAAAGAVGGGAYIAMGGSGTGEKKKKKEKSSRSAKVSKDEPAPRDVEVADQAAAPLIPAEASQASQAPQYMYAPAYPPQMSYASGQPMPMATPLTGMLPPVYTVAAPIYLNEAGEPIPMQYEAAPVAEMPAP